MSLINSLFNILRFNQKNWKAVVLCIVAATVFWFLNALNKQYTTNINFPLAFEYDDRYYIPVEELPDKIKINVTGLGWDLFRRSTGFKSPALFIPLKSPAEVKKIVGGTLPALFSSQLPTLQINFVVADTLNLHIEPRATRWLSLSVDSVNTYLRATYGLTDDIRIQPDSILIDGPVSIVNALQEPYSLDLREKDIDSNFNDDVEVRLPQGHLIKRNPPIVEVSFHVQKFVDLSDSVSVRFINLPRNKTLQVQKPKLLTTLSMPQSVAKDFSWDSVYISVDYKAYAKGHDEAAQVMGIPPFVNVGKVDSLHVPH